MKRVVIRRGKLSFWQWLRQRVVTLQNLQSLVQTLRDSCGVVEFVLGIVLIDAGLVLGSFFGIALHPWYFALLILVPLGILLYLHSCYLGTEEA